MPTKKPLAEVRGGVLRPNAAIQEEFVTGLLALVRRMSDETKRALVGLFDGRAADAAMDENLSVSARVAINNLMAKYEPLFNRWAKKATKRMVQRTLKYSSVSLGMSLREVAEELNLNLDLLHTDRMQEVIAAVTEEAAGLIKLIPTKYLSEVQGQVMRSITSGNGLQDLVPYLNEKYDGNIRHARNVAMDQTRKAYNGINAARMQAAGITEYEWVHTGGSAHPRQDHIAMSGNVYRLDDPPVIGVMYGKEVRGKPGDLPFCRCVMRPRLSFGNKE